MAASAMRFGFRVLTPIRPPSGNSTISSVSGSLRFGSGERDSHTGRPGAVRPSMAPGLGTWTVVSFPSARVTSARNRL